MKKYMKKYNLFAKILQKVSMFMMVGVLTFGMSSCNFLDIVPEESATEADAFKDFAAARRYLYSCYSYLPDPRSGNESLDFMTSDEIVTAFEHEVFANFPQGNYTPVNPIISYWNSLFKGIRQCYLLLDNIDIVPEMDQSMKEQYKAESTFLIAYYHYLLLKCYGPTILITELPDVNMSIDDFPNRLPYDDCVEWISFKFDEAISLGLPEKQVDTDYGRATASAALAIKSRMLLYAASPLFNGGSTQYNDTDADNLTSAWQNFKNEEGEPLINPNYEASKWQKAADATLKAINSAEAAGAKLYQAADLSPAWVQPSNLSQRLARYVIVDRNTPENVWTQTRGEGYYSVQRKSTPINDVAGGSWNGVSPTLRMVEAFYTENGLPVDEDPSYDYAGKFEIYTKPITDSINFVGSTMKLNVGREPRFYSWVAFHNSWYELSAYDHDLGATKESHEKMIVQFRKNDNCGIGVRTNNYSPTGYLNKKLVNPNFARRTGGDILNYPWPVIRLAELYLNYAEALIEVGGDANLTTAKNYIDKVRVRASIPTIDEAWSKVPGVSLNQDKLRQIVRQERSIELFLEGHRFWDVRRWLLGTKFFNVQVQGLNIQGTTEAELFTPKTVNYTRKFRSPANYLLPIPIADINKNPKIVQNPGY